MRSTSMFVATAAFVLSFAGAESALAVPPKSLHAFAGTPDGGFPHGGVIADSSGALYGTASSSGPSGNGTVYKLSPPAAGKKKWTETTLYAFTGGADGATPYAALMMDGSGGLYGTTLSGGTSGNGVVFKLTPPAQGQSAWTQSVIWTFTGGNDGGQPISKLTEDATGNIYGTATIGGTGVVGVVFKLTPPAQGQSAWTESIPYNFTGNADGGEPFGNVLIGGDGALYGTTAGYGTYNYGTVYRLVPQNGSYKFELLHAFKGGDDGEVPRDGMIADETGALYGTTAGFDNSQGTVFKLTPPAAGKKVWKQDVLTVFHGQGFTGNGPWATVSQDGSGALYGTTLGVGETSFGEVFKLTPPAAGRKKWHAKVLHAFQGGVDSQNPYSTPLVGSHGQIYVTSTGSAGQFGFYPGDVWEMTP